MFSRPIDILDRLLDTNALAVENISPTLLDLNQHVISASHLS